MAATTIKEPRTNGAPVTSGSGKRSKYQRREAASVFKWSDVEAAALGECVQAVTAAGDAILFGTASNGGIGVITVCCGPDRLKYYCKDAEEASLHLASIENDASDSS